MRRIRQHPEEHTPAPFKTPLDEAQELFTLYCWYTNHFGRERRPKWHWAAGPTTMAEVERHLRVSRSILPTSDIAKVRDAGKFYPYVIVKESRVSTFSIHEQVIP